MRTLEGKRALVTGGASGIGRAIALAFAAEGAQVAVVDRAPPDKIEAVVAEIAAQGGRACAVQADVADEAQVLAMVETVVARFGGLDILVNNAAYQMAQPSIEQITTEQFDSVFKTNVYAMFWITKAALKHLPEGASIINTASIQAYEPSPSLVDYAQTKACIVSFTKSMAKQLAEKGIRVNAVAPGPFWTPLIPSTLPAEQVKTFGSDAPLKRPGQPAELAATYVLLASPGATYVTGEVFGNVGGDAPY
jgi:NAD(P)-dependent dehydrogenase (short-subunit alcohol dehydrogenase family)